MMEVSFSQRFQNITSITNALLAAGAEPTQAREIARSQEEETRQAAQSLEEYQRIVDGLISKSEKNGSTHQDEPEALFVDTIFNEDGPTFGQYIWATYHADGRTSEVFKAKTTREEAAEKMVALKVTIPARLEPPHNSEREARILKVAKQQSIVPLLESFWQSGGRFILVFPFLRQDLENLMRSGNLDTKQCRMIFQGLFDALQHLHALGIIHRDIKPSSIMLKHRDGPVYLTDFGIAWSPEDPESEEPDRKITDVGTTCYRAPELLFGFRGYDTSLDIWAAGCVVAEMVSKGHGPLFDAGPLGSELGLIKSIFTTLGTPNDESWPSARKYSDWGKMRFQDFSARPWEEILPGVAPAAIDFVKRTVCIESSTRLTAEAARRHLLSMNISVMP